MLGKQRESKELIKKVTNKTGKSTNTIREREALDQVKAAKDFSNCPADILAI